MQSDHSRQRGFTLIELLVTIAIAAVLLMVAVPGMTTFKRNAELTSAINSLLGAVNQARTEAFKRGMNAMVVPINGTNWNSGVRVFVDKDRNLAYTDATADSLVLEQPPLPSYLTITPGNNPTTVGAASPYLMFDASGYSRTMSGTLGPSAAATLTIARNDVTGTELVAQTRRLVVASTGRARTCKPDSATDTKCATSSTN